jgi:asparagine synthase (glutamine-hydrolysing)
MCGIAAIFAYGTGAPPVAGDELARIGAAMQTRGPDGDALWMSVDGRVGLAHRRLAIIDPGPTGAQPMALTERGASTTIAADARAVITFNGEIYNFRALKSELEAHGCVFATNSDTEVLLHLYARDGERMVEKLRGMYAFAIWDGARRGLFLARDPFGIKPLYVADDGATVRAASQVKALLAGGGIDTAPNAAGHVGFFLFGYVPEPHTLYKTIRALPAGGTLWIGTEGRGGGQRHTSRIDPLTEPAGVVTHADNEATLHAALCDSVRHHLVADVPVGVFLSAGLDSATITALAAETAGGALETFTLSFAEFANGPRDEAPLAKRIAETYGTRHTVRQVAGESFHDSRAALMAAMDQPTIDGVNTYFVAREARAAGLKVALSGLGGDEMFGGYDTFRDVPLLVDGIGWLPGIDLLGRGFRALTGQLLSELTTPKLASLFEYATSYGSAYLLRRGLFLPWELADVMDPEFAAEGWRALDPIARLDKTAEPQPTARGRVGALEMAWYMRNQLLRDADWAGMAHSLEIRVPLVDVALYRAVAAFGFDKQAMARAPKQPLPREIMTRPKSGFFVPVREWLGGSGESKDRGLRGWARSVYAAQVA